LPSKGERQSIPDAIKTWAFIDKTLSTRKRPKKFVRMNDFKEFYLAAFSPSVPFSSNLMRIEPCPLQVSS